MPFPSLPHLRDLQSDTRIFEHDLMDTTTDSERGNGSSIPRPCALLPALRHWNITTTPPLHFGMTFFVRLSVLAPSLSHIRVTSGCFIPGPGRIMSNYTRGSPRLLASLPSGIQKLYVKPVTPVAPGRIGSPAYIMRILMDLNALGDARFVLLSPCVGYRERYAVGEWLERVDGGEGCWSLREQILPGEE
ncbi:hypothetical protein FIBSPDRAFT_875078 [Athelia psychrophila]|uniref:Uncharacterized protein n=1 Tax=Athelia psychrophila TaxID=1759441 RepID=A0A165WQV8_9AGAM|nr:hypothetical protein FIBSPDRAFT_875078 [Fibularhizoctonia sp. CBS 109695]